MVSPNIQQGGGLYRLALHFPTRLLVLLGNGIVEGGQSGIGEKIHAQGLFTIPYSELQIDVVRSAIL